LGCLEIIWENHLPLPFYQMKLLDLFFPFTKAHYFFPFFWSVTQLVSSVLDATGYLFKPWGVPSLHFFLPNKVIDRLFLHFRLWKSMTMLKYTITWYFIKIWGGCTIFQPAMYSQSAAMWKIGGCALSLKLYHTFLPTVAGRHCDFKTKNSICINLLNTKNKNNLFCMFLCTLKLIMEFVKLTSVWELTQWIKFDFHECSQMQEVDIWLVGVVDCIFNGRSFQTSCKSRGGPSGSDVLYRCIPIASSP